MQFWNWLQNLNVTSRQTRRARKTQHVASEQLEQRTLPAVSVLLIGGSELNIASDGNDSIIVRSINGTVAVETTIPGQPFTQDQSLSGVAAASIQSILITGGDQENLIDLSNVRSADFTALTDIQVRAFHGDDSVLGSPDIANLIFGEDGNDTLVGGAASDSIDGGDGSDSLTSGGGDDDVVGGDGSDAIDTGDGNDSVNAGNGQDTISLGAGNDFVFSGNGQDFVTGGTGNDTLNGDGGTDTVFGGDGNDSILGGEFDDSLSGDMGNDTILGQGGADTIDGGLNDDSIKGGAGRDSMLGNFGNDFLGGEADHDTILGGDGNDTVLGGAGKDSINGEGGDDVIRGQGGNDSILGGAGDERSADLLDGGDGNDIIQTATPAAETPIRISINDGSRIEGNSIVPFGLVSSFNTGLGTNNQTGISSGDYDADGDTDLAITGDVGGPNDQLRIMLNNGSGLFVQGALLPTGSRPLDVTSADFDGDGDVDLAVTEQGSNTMSVFLNNGDATFAPRLVNTLPNFVNLQGIGSGDFDGDGDQDIVTADGNQDLISFFFNDGTANFLRSDLTLGAGFFSDPRDLVVDDLDGDGDVDVAVTLAIGFFTQDVAVVINTGGTFAVSQFLSFPAGRGNNPDQIDTLDFDNDGDQDLVVSDQFSNTIELFRNDLGAGFVNIAPLTAPGFFGNVFLTTNDFNQDGNEDVVAVSDNFTQAIAYYQGNGDGTFQPVQTINLPAFAANGGPVTNADFNGDGAADLAIASIFGGFFNNQGLFILLNNIPQITFTITLSEAGLVPVTVNFTTSDGTATAGTDYTALSSSVTFAPGETVKSFSVRTTVDLLPEDNENFFVTITGVQTTANAVVEDGQAQGVILDDDQGQVGPTLSIDDVLISPEGTGAVTNAVFTVSLSGPSLTPVAVDFSTASDTASAGSDFSPQSGQLVFAPGTTSLTITVPVAGDNSLEADEQFFVNLSNPIGAVTLDSRGSAIIIDDDVAPGLTTQLGGAGNDTLVGSDADELLNGGNGDDLINAAGGNDTVVGGNANDTLNGEAGDDSLNGQGGNDVLNGGDGDDTLVGQGSGTGDDTVVGGNGFDTVSINGNSGINLFGVSVTADGRLKISEVSSSVTVDRDIHNVLINNGGGNDVTTVTGNFLGVQATVLTINGDGGNDVLDANGATMGNVRLGLFGGLGNDTLTGSNSNDTIDGGDGDDACGGQSGNDLIIGGAGNDSLGGGLGDDTLDGGDGLDSLNGQQGNDSISGGLGSDTLKGEDGNDTLLGNDGDDNLNGMAGDDSLSGSLGRDAIVGGTGNDTLDGGRNDDTLGGNSGNDKIRGDHGNDSINGGDGDDTINGGDGNDTILGGLGNDGVNAGDGDDVVNSDGGDDTVIGGDGADALSGGGDQDIVLGEDGTDTVNGQGGTDIVAGGQGVDVIIDPIAEINEQFVLSNVIRTILNAL